jgi:hypothetical protein
MKQDEIFPKVWNEWNEIDKNISYLTWSEFKKNIPSSLPTWKEFRQQLPVGYADTLRQNMDIVLYIPGIHPLQREEILDLFENFHRNREESFNPQVQQRTFFANGVERTITGLIWKIAVGPDFIACYSDGGMYTLVSQDMASKDLEEFIR